MAIKTITRLTLERQLNKICLPDHFGDLLEVGASQTFSPYKHLFKARGYYSLDRDQSFGPHICSDLCQMGIKDNAFDTILLFEVLEHIFYPHRAIQEIYRILRPGGICLLSTRFIFQYHPSPNDYFRFSRDALERLFGAFSDIEILAHGNQWQTTWQLILARELELPRPFFVKILRRLNKVFACTNKPDNRAPLGFLVRAVK